MPFIATTTVSVLRGTDTNEYGDPVDLDVPVYTGVPTAITTKQKTVLVEDTSEPRTVRWYIGRVLANFDIQENDRLRDERTGIVYLVDNVTRTVSMAQSTGCLLDLRVVND